MPSERIRTTVSRQLRPAILLFILLTIITGILYPLLVTGIAQVAFPAQANGGFIKHNGMVAGSTLIGQPFTSPGYFWGRPSATSPAPDNAGASAGSNLGPSNPALADAVRARIDALHAADPANTLPVPADLVTTSASGFDPDISPAAAYYQVPRIARERGIPEDQVRSLVASHIRQPDLGFMGEPRINVLSLNLALDDIAAHRIEVTGVSAVPPEAAGTLFSMKISDWLQLIVFGLLLAFLVVPVGRFMARVYRGEPNVFFPVITRVESWLLRASGINPDEEMDWKAFAIAMLLFNLIGIIVLYAIQEIQQFLPLNPAGMGPVSWDLALNTAVSFTTNTNWQAYAGETTLSYFTQMSGLAVQNFLSAATGMAVLIALVYGLSRRSTDRVGNFWVLLVRSVMILLPVSVIIALVLVSQGTVQTFEGPVTVPLLDPVRDGSGALVMTQTIPLGPAASQVAIKLLGTNGGGFFNVNSAHPFENPTPLSNFIEVLALLLIPVCLCYTFGKMIGSARKGIAILIAMALIFVPLVGLAIGSEISGNPALSGMGIDQVPGAMQPGGNMEGKEVRFGVPAAAFWSLATTATSCGAVNAMHDSFTPLAGFAQLLMMQFGEVVFGGVGSGLYGMLVFVVIAMFIAGLMVGRTPEYLGKKIEPFEMKLATVIILIPIFVILTGVAIAVLTVPGRVAILNPGPHGFSEILYAFTSAAQNNGSAFAGLSANSLFYNIGTALAMLIGRFGPAVLTLALAGSFAAKKIVPVSEGTLLDHRPLFIIWIVFVVAIIGALSFLPALALGPIVEHLILASGSGVHI
jgi:K+-transporting ATPase ATPase A chain